jgi:hypothetical protein
MEKQAYLAQDKRVDDWSRRAWGEKWSQTPLRGMREARSLSSRVPQQADFLSRRPPGVKEAVLTLDAWPASPRRREFNCSNLEAIITQVQEWLHQGIVEKSTAFVAYNPVLVPKKNGKLRMCIDYSPLNKHLAPFDWPLPRIQDLRHRIRGATRFSRLDMLDAFFNITMAPGSRAATTFWAGSAKYQFRKMPFGLSVAPAIFQRFMDWALRGFCDCVFIYLDDVLIFTRTRKNHLAIVRRVERALASEGILINQEKSERDQPSLLFVGHIISAQGIAPSEKITQLQHARRPNNRVEAQSFIGYANFFRDYVPNFADMARPIYAQTGTRFQWDEACENAFMQIARIADRAVALHHPIDGKEFDLYADASNVATGAVLTQAGRVIAVSSKTLQGAQVRYSTTDRENLALVHAVEAFRLFVGGSRVILHTDHAALLTRRPDQLTPMQWRWRMTIEQWVSSLSYIEGKKNPADFWSRVEQQSAQSAYKYVASGHP